MAVTKRAPIRRGKLRRRNYKARSATVRRPYAKRMSRSSMYSVRRYIPRSLNPFPKNRLVRHRYVDNFTLPAAGGAGQTRTYIFACNDMFDPNVTATGHQPLFRDEMAAVYPYYTVIASYAKVTFDQSSTNQQNYGIICTQDVTISSDPTTVLEQYGGRPPLIGSQRNSPLVIRSSFDAKKKFGTTFAGIMGDDAQKIAAATSPAAKNAFYFVVWSGPSSALVTLPAEKCQIELIYICYWREARDGTQS